jgi:hypothetical protein
MSTSRNINITIADPPEGQLTQIAVFFEADGLTAIINYHLAQQADGSWLYVERRSLIPKDELRAANRNLHPIPLP